MVWCSRVQFSTVSYSRVEYGAVDSRVEYGAVDSRVEYGAVDSRVE